MRNDHGDGLRQLIKTPVGDRGWWAGRREPVRPLSGRASRRASAVGVSHDVVGEAGELSDDRLPRRIHQRGERRAHRVLDHRVLSQADGVCNEHLVQLTERI